MKDDGTGIEYESATLHGQAIAELSVLSAREPLVELADGQEVRPTQPDVASEQMPPPGIDGTALSLLYLRSS